MANFAEQLSALNQTLTDLQTTVEGIPTSLASFPEVGVSMGQSEGGQGVAGSHFGLHGAQRVAARHKTETLDINAGWTLLSGYLVFFMQCGFAMLCAGAVRAKNAKNIILLNILDSCFGAMAWYITGFAFAFGDPAPDENGEYPTLEKSQSFIGNRFFCMSNLPRTMYVSWFFQFTFAATGATIVSGAVAERCRFEAYMLYELMIVMFVYPVVAHWVWSPFGWLSALRTPATSYRDSYVLFAGAGVYDFAGDGPVHMVGGFASLAGAWILGPRIGRFDSAGNPVDMPGHNASLNLLGVFLLWFGWYGFNPGSTNAIINNASGRFVEGGFSGVSAAIAVNTTVAAAAGTLSCLFIAMAHNYFSLGVIVWDLIIAGNGALAGLVSITGPCHVVNTWAAIIIGLIGGGVYYMVSKINLHLLKVDDPLDAIAVHAGCGAWGVIGSAAFAAENMVLNVYGPSPYPDSDGGRPYGFIMGGDGKVLASSVVYIIVIAAWVLGIMTPFFFIIKRIGLMRVAPEVEAEGLDVSLHGGSAYPHDKTGGAGKLDNMVGGGPNITVDMVDRKIAEALEKMRLEMKSSNGVPPV
ncbi:hypothetical protein N2152v2_009184 [Parachlorella kessleri]